MTKKNWEIYLTKKSKELGICELEYYIHNGEIDLTIDLISVDPLKTIDTLLLLKENDDVITKLLQKARLIFESLLKIQKFVYIKEDSSNKLEVFLSVGDISILSKSEINQKLKVIRENTKDDKIKRMIKEQKMIGLYSGINKRVEEIINLFNIEMIEDLEDFHLFLEEEILIIYFGLVERFKEK